MTKRAAIETVLRALRSDEIDLLGIQKILKDSRPDAYTFVIPAIKDLSFVKQITHEANGLKIVMRELTGADVLDRPHLLRSLAMPIAKPINRIDAEGNIDLPDRIWARIGHVVDVIQHTVSFTGDGIEGQGSFSIPSVDDSSEDLFDFYNFLTGLPGMYVEFFQKALEKVNADPLPNPDGAKTETPSVSAPVPDSLAALPS